MVTNASLRLGVSYSCDFPFLCNASSLRLSIMLKFIIVAFSILAISTHDHVNEFHPLYKKLTVRPIFYLDIVYRRPSFDQYRILQLGVRNGPARMKFLIQYHNFSLHHQLLNPLFKNGFSPLTKFDMQHKEIIIYKHRY